MSYVVYNMASTEALRIPFVGIKYFANAAAAKAALTRGLKAGKLKAGEWAVAEAGEFHAKIEKSVVRRNLMSGEEFLEPVNTPGYCSPSSEAYWSM